MNVMILMSDRHNPKILGCTGHEVGCCDNAMAYAGVLESWGHALQRSDVRVESIGKLHYASADAPTRFDHQTDPMHVMGGIGQVWGSVRGPLPRKEGAPFLVAPHHPYLAPPEFFERYDAPRSPGPSSIRSTATPATRGSRPSAACSRPRHGQHR
jgi:choline-sulfatase